MNKGKIVTDKKKDCKKQKGEKSQSKVGYKVAILLQSWTGSPRQDSWSMDGHTC